MKSPVDFMRIYILTTWESGLVVLATDVTELVTWVLGFRP
jgi:hypothetical protein